MKLTTIAGTLVLVATLAAAPLEAGWNRGALQSGTGVQAQNPLSPEEESTLLFMREEEKMARDVYLTLFDLWEHPVFDNISAAEQRHMNAMKNQIDRYGLVDPVTDDTVGVFDNEELGALYLDLVAMGGKSLEMALRAGVLIEEIDILDLENAIAESTHDDVTRAYENLLRGSRNHLRAFVGQLESLGIVYEAQKMDQARLDEIVDSPMERGGRKAKRKGCKGRGGRF